MASFASRLFRHDPPEEQNSAAGFKVKSTPLDASSVTSDLAHSTTEQPLMASDEIMREALQNDAALLKDGLAVSARNGKRVIAMRNRAIVATFETIEEAEAACDERFPDRVYSLHFVDVVFPEQAAPSV